MKVLCINNKYPKTPHLLKPEHWIYEGEVYTVHSSYQDAGDSLIYYYLEEKMQDDPPPSYRANRFVLLSGLDQRENERERAPELETVENRS